jgi:hypothetical protein
MNEPTEPQGTPVQRRQQEFEDPHYHDDEGEVVPVDDIPARGSRLPNRRKPVRRPPPRRHYED